MNRGRDRSAKLRAEAAGRATPASIDLGFALSVYGKDADGRLVEIQQPDMQDPRWDGFSGHDIWPTEQ